MPRVRWCRLSSLLFILVFSAFWIVSATADCWYDSKKHEEGSEVATAEPCLNCTCSRGALLCYLRVCPKLPDPPPPGCILLHRYMRCCPELICTDIPGGGNGIEARSDPESFEIEYDNKLVGNACVFNGSIYGPGSAMGSSTLCEYCYCLGGRQRCVKPKCLLPLEGCTPMYEPPSCCPVRYNCTEPPPSVTTTTLSPYIEERSGCIVDNTFYPEGGKVLGVGHSICDNCYCIRGLLRCEPLSCAPPLLGCTPVIKPGECCAASYNCSGVIEIQPEPNYGEYPIVSKEYAKLRKEVQQKPQQSNKATPITENSNVPFYVIAESQQKSKNPTTRHFTGTQLITTKEPYYHETHTPKSQQKTTQLNTVDYVKKPSHFSGVFYATTNYESRNGNYRRPISTTNKPKVDHTTFSAFNSITSSDGDDKDDEKLRFDDYDDLSKQAILSIVDALLDGTIPEKLHTKGDEREETTNIISTTEFQSESTTVSTNSDFGDSTTENYSEMESTATTIINTTDCTESIVVETLEENTTDINAQKRNDYSFITTILPDDINEINKLEEVSNLEALSTTTELEDTSTEATTTENVIKLPSEQSQVKVTQYDDAIPKIPPEIEAILNITKNKDSDYEYDYNEPSLPPSLPNLRIIPFVAADALDSKKADAQDNTIYPIGQERVTDPALFSYSSLFSPPVETEGGFVPKEPPLLDNFYENGYHTTGVDVNAVTSLPVPSITTLPKTNEHNCLSNGLEVRHGESVPSSSPCVLCACFYGNVICQPPQCAPIRPNCRQTNMADRTSCCPHYICDDEEAPTVVLDRIEGTSSPQELVTVADGIVTPDPFRDVIRTEPAPDLQSLIGDIMPFLARKTTTVPPTRPISLTTTKENEHSLLDVVKRNDTKNSDGDGEFSFQNALLQLLFPGDTKSTVTTTNGVFNNERDFNKTSATADTTTTTTMNLVETSTTKNNNSNNKWSDSSAETDNTERDLPNPNNPNRTSTYPTTTAHPNSVEASPGVGLLKLAGCNIYGRMYRVGRIISELSGPCLECKCTEIGVQCRALNC